MAIEATGYSIWLEPSGQYAAQLEKIIARLAGDFNSPVFSPHVTLVGGISGTEREVVRSARQLALDLSPFLLLLGREIICEPHWTRALAVRAQRTVSLVEANTRARKIFDLQAQAAFDPHMSLLYTEVIPEEMRLQATHSLFGRGVFGGRFKVDNLAVYRCNGPVESWRKVAAVPLDNS